MPAPDNLIDQMIRDVIAREGPFVDHPSDPGGATCWGVTEAVARKHGYNGHMRDLPKSTAAAIYYADYYEAPKFDQVARVSPKIAIELFDSGVNCGTGTASRWLQTALNAFNQKEKDYPDLVVDGRIGLVTLRALEKFLFIRRAEGEMVMLRALNGQQTAHYLNLTKQNSKFEDFVYGWIRNRVS